MTAFIDNWLIRSCRVFSHCRLVLEFIDRSSITRRTSFLRLLNGRINIETVVCADASLAHEKLARALGFTFKKLVTSSGIRVIEGVFHLQHVNAYHSHLKQWITGIFHGVATKYLSHYLGWRRALTGINALTSDRLGNKILEFLHFNP